MPVSIVYEDFSDTVAHPSEAEGIGAETQKTADTLTRASFEDGYKEGWIDAQTAAQNEASELNSEVATALQEAGFAYFEARQHIFNSMRPLLEAIVEQVVPELARETFTLKVVEQVEAIARETDTPMKIVCAPSTKNQLIDVLKKHVSFPVEVRSEDTLTETQAVLEFSEGQTHVDLTSIVEDLRSAVSGFFDLNVKEDQAYG